MYIIRRLIDQLQWQLRLVEWQRLFIRQLRCFRQHLYKQYSWIMWLRRYKRMFRLERYMDRLILIQYHKLQHIRKRSPLNHHRILGFRMMLNNQLIIVLRMIISFCWLRSSILLMILLLRKPSMNHIDLDSWLL